MIEEPDESVFDTATAEHEAAHIVVGLALGLKLKKAAIAPARPGYDSGEGYTWFAHGRTYLAFGIMTCAGIAWEQRPGGEPHWARADAKHARQILRTKASVETGVRLARELIETRRALLAKIASELCERDLGPADVEALVLGG